MSSWSEVFKIKNIRNLIFLDIIGNLSQGIYQPFLSLYMINNGASLYHIGLINSIGSIFSIIFSFLIGFSLDKLGPKKMAIFGILLGSLPLAFYPSVTNWMQFIPWNVASSISMITLIPVRDVIITTSVNIDERAHIYGLELSLVPIGGIIGPIIGGYITEIYNIKIVFLVSFIIKIMSIFFALKLTTSIKTTNNYDVKKINNIKNIKKISNVSHIFSLIYLFILLRAISAFSMINAAYIPIYITEKFGFTKKTIGIFYTIVNIFRSIMAMFIGSLTNKYGKKRIMMFSSIICPFLVIIYLRTNNSYIFSVIYMLQISLNAIQQPIARVLMMNSVTDNLGFTASLGTFGFRTGHALGSFVSGYIGEIYGISFIFYFIFLIMIIKIPIILKIKENKAPLK